MSGTTETVLTKYQISTDFEITEKNGVRTGALNNQHCITFMSEYANKSVEELRLEDYQINSKRPQAYRNFGGGLFGLKQPIAGGFQQTSAAPNSFAAATRFGAFWRAICAAFGGSDDVFSGVTQPRGHTPSNRSFVETTATRRWKFGSAAGEASTFCFGQVRTSALGAAELVQKQQPMDTGIGFVFPEAEVSTDGTIIEPRTNKKLNLFKKSRTRKKSERIQD